MSEIEFNIESLLKALLQKGIGKMAEILENGEDIDKIRAFREIFYAYEKLVKGDSDIVQDDL